MKLLIVQFSPTSCLFIPLFTGIYSSDNAYASGGVIEGSYMAHMFNKIVALECSL
jgi:hypothetical protein